jgi:2,4-dienoyl-CoA reductase-like NADH-dependent reductase (Old Yellow Enzyme family)
MSKIFNPLQLKSVTIPNRIGMPPMCQYSAENGMANNWHLAHYGARAVGGVGLIIVEATGVSPEGRITPYDLGIWHDAHIEPLAEVVQFIHGNGSVAAIQLAHAGRKASHDAPINGGKQLSAANGGWKTVAPSPIPFENNEIVPKELSIAEIEKLIFDFRQAAKRALKAGFKIIEIHGAHGYLIHEFLSPLTNIRTDEYGGNLENRSRLLFQIIDAVQEVWPANLPLFVRLSATDWKENGWNVDETVKLCNLLKNKGVDLIDCSSGGNIFDAKMDVKPLYQVPFSEAIRETGIPTATVGLITNQAQIEQILENEQADLVLLGRELLRNPYFVLHLNEKDQPKWPVQYMRAK